MIVDKSYQDSPSLQAIYDASHTKSKLFLGVFSRCIPDRWIWLNREPLTKDSGVGIRQNDRLLDDLVDDGVLLRQSHGFNRSHACAFKITPFGYEVMRIYQQIHKINKYIILTVSLLLSPVKTNVSLLSSKVFIKEVVSSSSESKLLTAPARETQNTHISQTTARKEADVGSMEHKNMDLPDYVVSLTPTLQLTTHGQLKLSIFDKETVDYCWATIQQASGCKDVFKELANLCVKYCEDNDTRPAWPVYFEGIESGFAAKKDRYTSKTITSAMIKPKVAKQDVNPFAESASFTAYKNRDKSKDPVRWIDQQEKDNPERHRSKAAEYLAYFEDLRGEKAPADVKEFLKVEVVVSKPAEWSQTDKQLVDWCLNYIGKMTTGKAFYAAFEQEILLGPDSPRARTRELQEGLKLMQRLAYREIANQVIQEPLTKVVTELKDQIVCAQIANDDAIWENLKYSPIKDDGVFEEVLD